MKKIAKKIKLHKSEAERTKTQKIIRDVVFFGVVIYAAVLTFLLFNAETEKVEAEANYIAMNSAISVIDQR